VEEARDVYRNLLEEVDLDHRDGDYIKMDLKVICVRMGGGWDWLRTVSIDGLRGQRC
jgi:hypothetical protein